MTEKASVTPPLFENSAREILDRLVGQTPTSQVLAMRTEAEELIATFQAWAKERPEDPVRAETVNRLFSLNRRVLEYMITHH
jgi:hypothetical protein